MSRTIEVEIEMESNRSLTTEEMREIVSSVVSEAIIHMPAEVPAHE